MLAEEREGIAFQHNIAEAVADLVFVMSAFNNPWDEYFPDPCFDALSHLMGTAIPAIKIANHADPVEHWELVKALITNTRSATASAMC